MPVSNDPSCAPSRRHGMPTFAPRSVLRSDDGAWRRNHRYGTLGCDLDWRKTIALLTDREPARAEAWLTGRPHISVVARIAMAVMRSPLPDAVQVANRGHRMENATRASSTPSANRCVRSEPRPAPRQLILRCSPPASRSRIRSSNFPSASERVVARALATHWTGALRLSGSNLHRPAIIG